ncbi:MAG: lysophospholipid acyltransferase family protein [Chthoniobacterales bacterium]|nr:lysophospholipid acyltransferase family protein [Chthoniobacterales bacterium]
MQARAWFRHFAVRGVFWRQYLDFAQTDVPFYLRTIMIVLWTCFFYVVAAPARRALLRNVEVVLPGSNRLTNHFRAWFTLFNFSWTISDAADHKLLKTEFAYSVDGAENLESLAASKGAILLTAHMGSYDLGAALFAGRYHREIRMVRAPEIDEKTAQHVDESLARATGGAIKVAYSSAGMALPLELLNALRAGEIVSILGDRATDGISQRETRLFGELVRLPDGPFILAFVTQAPIYPVFILRTSFHHYKIVAGAPFYCRRAEGSRDAAVEEALGSWCRKLEEVIRPNWSQWFSLVPIFPE